jgi:hypothetical protein
MSTVRPEVTGRAGAGDVCAAFSVEEFCRRNDISEALFWKLRRENRGPQCMELGRILRITPHAEAAWHRARENPDAAETELIARARAMRTRLARKAGKAAAASPKHISKQGRRRKRR